MKNEHLYKEPKYKRVGKWEQRAGELRLIWKMNRLCCVVTWFCSGKKGHKLARGSFDLVAVGTDSSASDMVCPYSLAFVSSSYSVRNYCKDLIYK